MLKYYIKNCVEENFKGENFKGENFDVLIYFIKKCVYGLMC